MTIAVACLILTGIPTVTFLRNLRHFRRVPRLSNDQLGEAQKLPPVSVLIPARNEAARIEVAIRALLQSTNIEIEICVLDDHSEDATAEIIKLLAEEDSRVRLHRSRELLVGWNGKQFACHQLSQLAKFDRWLFMDADVLVHPHAIARLAIAFESRSADAKQTLSLLSAFPHQQTGSLGEKLLVPLMHFALLGFLPMWRMQKSKHPAYAAGCGQMFFTSREDYMQVATDVGSDRSPGKSEPASAHAVIKASRHDGIELPRAFRRAGFATDIVDGTDLASVRMYDSFEATWQGIKKNATEGFARPLLMPFVTLFCLAPLASAIAAVWLLLLGAIKPAVIAFSAYCVALIPRLIASLKFRQTMLGSIMHVDGLLLFLCIQWSALIDSLLGKQVAWRGRKESTPCEVNQPTK